MAQTSTQAIEIHKSSVRISSTMSASEITAALVGCGCKDVSDQINPDRCGTDPFYGGGCADIFKGELIEGDQVAIKCLRLYLQSNRSNILKHAAHELYAWSRLKHDNVIELTGLAQYRGRMAMISPWMENGTLSTYLTNNPDADCRQLCIGICSGVAYLHENDIIHGDIKSANVLVCSKGTAKLTDFGCTMLKSSTLAFTTTTGAVQYSTRWAAPEILAGKESSKMSDVYALGMTLLEVVTGKVPFHSKQEMQVYHAVVSRHEIPSRPERFPSFDDHEADILWAMMVDSWRQDPALRPVSSFMLNSFICRKLAKSNNSNSNGLVLTDSDKSVNPGRLERGPKATENEWRDRLPGTEDMDRNIEKIGSSGNNRTLMPQASSYNRSFEQYHNADDTQLLPASQSEVPMESPSTEKEAAELTNSGASESSSPGSASIVGSNTPSFNRFAPSALDSGNVPTATLAPRNTSDPHKSATSLQSAIIQPSVPTISHDAIDRQRWGIPENPWSHQAQLTGIPRNRVVFENVLRIWFRRGGNKSENIPRVDDKPLDLYRLYIETEKLGGMRHRQAAGLWHTVAMKLGYVTSGDNSAQAQRTAEVLGNAYTNLIVPFDDFCLARIHDQILQRSGNQQREQSIEELGNSVGLHGNSIAPVAAGLPPPSEMFLVDGRPNIETLRRVLVDV